MINLCIFKTGENTILSKHFETFLTQFFKKKENFGNFKVSIFEIKYVENHSKSPKSIALL